MRITCARKDDLRSLQRGDVLPQLAVQAHSFLGTPPHPYKVHALWHPQGTPGGNGHVGIASRSTSTDRFDRQEYFGSKNQGARNISFVAESATKELKAPRGETHHTTQDSCISPPACKQRYSCLRSRMIQPALRQERQRHRR